MQTLIPALTLAVTLFVSPLAEPCFAQTTTAVASASAPAKATYTITVVVSDVNKRTGKLYIGLADSDETFTGKSAQQKAVAVPASGEITVTFDNLPAGKYAVRVYQDLNDNAKMDFSGQMPAEPFGFSNVTMLMGPPSFGQSAFDLSENKSVKITMMEM